MRKGHFIVSNELMNDSQWPLIRKELDNVFTVEAIISGGGHQTIFYGTSHLFQDTIELVSVQYTAHFKTVDNKPVFVRFESV